MPTTIPRSPGPRRLTVAAVLVGVLVGGCDASAPATTAPGPATTSSSGVTREPVTSEPSGATPGVPSDRPDLATAVALAPVATGLASPLWVTGAGDGSGRLFVVEQGGRVRVLRDGAVLSDPYLDLSDRIAAGGERGLLGFAFAPGFGTGEQRLYVHYSNTNGDTTLAELRSTPGADTVDPATQRIVLTEPQPYPNHNGGWIGFDPAGRLLLALGDGGGGGDPENRASRLGTILGKMLRLDVLAGPADGRQYAIPPDNPFVATAGARPEILDFGLRNPFRDSIDPATGTLWIGDVGQAAWEEIDAAPAGSAGLDFGWRRWEGRHCYNPAQGCDPAGVTMPVAEYGHDAGCAVIGGLVYRGRAIPALRGAYLFSDNCSGTLWAIDAAAGAQAPVVLLQTGLAVSSIGTGDDGEAYLTDLGGGVRRLVAAG